MPTAIEPRAPAARGAPGARDRDRRDDILHAVGLAARRFLGPGSFADTMDVVLGRLGEATGVSRVYVFQHQESPAGRTLANQRWEWVASGVEPQIDNPELQGLDYEAMGFGRWWRELAAGRALCGTVDSFPDTERDFLAAQDIRSLAVVPIRDGVRWWGFIGFDDCAVGRDWHPAEVDALHAAAGLLGAALQRQEQVRVLQERDAQLQQMQKMEALGRLARGIAHDVNNVLTIIGGETELLAEDLGNASGHARRGARAIASAVERGQELTRQLMDFSREQQPRPQRVSVSGILAKLESFVSRTLGRHVQVTVTGADDPSWIWFDPGQLEQVVLNLAINAHDAMPHGGELTLGVELVTVAEPISGQERRHVRLTVADTGVGMDAGTRARLFEPFFTTKPRGTGLGLATVYRTVQQAGGFITVDSAPGRGSRFAVHLPAVD